MGGGVPLIWWQKNYSRIGFTGFLLILSRSICLSLENSILPLSFFGYFSSLLLVTDPGERWRPLQMKLIYKIIESIPHGVILGDSLKQGPENPSF
ncbi:MAG: hypothetical protein Ct9H300mP6_06750 [Gammaproteobacteria bacterium]|nr:MAG: hypothetical protein Ct9H300mP6_06750 [Gammaproteobacteria bacterium]